MKTTLFYEIAGNSEVAKSILNDLRVAVGLDKSDRTLCMNNLLTLMRDVMTSRQRRELLERIVRESKYLNITSAMAAVRVLGFFLTRLADDDYKSATSEELAEDLIELAEESETPIGEKKKHVFVGLINSIRNDVLPQYNEVVDEKSAVAGVLPSMTSFGTTVEMRAVVGNPFRIGMKADAGYDPKITGLLPVISIRLATDSGVVDELAFQMSEKELSALIEELKSAQICLEKMQECIKQPVSPTGEEREIEKEVS